MDYGKELDKKKIIVFGGSRGIGFNIASHLILKGCNVTISSGNADNLHTAFETLKETLSAAQNLSSIVADFNSFQSLDIALSSLLTFGPFDAIIISSGILGPSGDFTGTAFADWVGTFQVNVFGPAKLIHYFLQNHLIGKNGKIIFLSGGISAPDPYFIAYSTTKHALNGFAYSLAHQLAKKNIWMNSILPGSYNTDMNQTRIERGPENIGHKNFQLSLSRTCEDDTEKYQKLHALIEWLCASDSDGVYGRLISAQYDDWQNHKERLKYEQDDLYKMIRKKD